MEVEWVHCQPWKTLTCWFAQWLPRRVEDLRVRETWRGEWTRRREYTRPSRNQLLNSHIKRPSRGVIVGQTCRFSTNRFGTSISGKSDTSFSMRSLNCSSKLATSPVKALQTAKRKSWERSRIGSVRGAFVRSSRVETHPSFIIHKRYLGVHC